MCSTDPKLENAEMRCYSVLVHGELEWFFPALSPVHQPAGFFCTRHVVARNEQEAAQKAFAKVRRRLDSKSQWLSSGQARLTFAAEEIHPIAFYKLLLPINRSHVFYDER